MSLAFLNTKGFHPNTMANQQKRFVAEQKEAERIRREKEAAKECVKNDEAFVLAQMLKAGGDPAKIKAARNHPLNFMYAAPPGLDRATASETLVAEGQGADGMDEAALAFEANIKRRRMLAGDDHRSALERSVGGSHSRAPLTLSQRAERFPELKNAPVEKGVNPDTVSAVPVVFGKVLRNVQCSRCGKWGHRVGDRECELRNELGPGEGEARRREDPMAGKLDGGGGAGRELDAFDPDGGEDQPLPSHLRTRSLQDLGMELTGRASIAVGDWHQSSSTALHDQIVLSDEGEDDDEHAVERGYLATLTVEEKRALLRRLEEREGGDKSGRKRKHKKKSKKQHHKHHKSSKHKSSKHSSSSSSSKKKRRRSSSSGSGSEGGR